MLGGFCCALGKARGCSAPGVWQVSQGCTQILGEPSGTISLEKKITAEMVSELRSNEMVPPDTEMDSPPTCSFFFIVKEERQKESHIA